MYLWNIHGARYYDPVLGRFITPDTIVQAPYDPQTLNRYAYCRNNPVKYIDPTGHIATENEGPSKYDDGNNDGGGTLGGQTGPEGGESKCFGSQSTPQGSSITADSSPDGGSQEGEQNNSSKMEGEGDKSESEKVKQMSDVELLHAINDAGKRKDAKRIRILQKECIRRNNLTPKKILLKAIKNAADIILSKQTGGIPITPIIDLIVESTREDVQHVQDTVVEEAVEIENKTNQLFMPRSPYSPYSWYMWSNPWSVFMPPSSEK